MKKLLIAFAGPLVLAAQPVAAQDEGAGDAAMEDAFAVMAGMFEVEPLTPEQEARMPAARALIDRIMPEGTMAEVMAGTFDGLLGPMLAATSTDSASRLSEMLSYADVADLSDDEAREALAIIDPAWEERYGLMVEAMESSVTAMMTRMEPVMRNVMAELYAIHFSDQQLADIDGFFATETGAYFARQSYLLVNDPRIMAALFEDPELLMGATFDMIAELETAQASLPATRLYADLTEEQRARLASLTGLSKEELEAALDAADPYTL